MKPVAPLLLSINGGYVDTAGFLAIQGLFTAHVTGNFVTLGAALVYGRSGVEAKLLALPVFCVAIALVRILGHLMERHPVTRQRTMLAIQLVLLLAAAVLAVRFGPFRDGDAAVAIVTGMVLVCGMAVQNAVQRVHLGRFPPTTMMTGNTTQVVLDLTDLLWLPTAAVDRAALHQRMRPMIAGICCFAAGCAAAALLFWLGGIWCFALPPLLVLGALVAITDGTARAPQPPQQQRRSTAA